MRKILFFIFLFTSASFFSCKKKYVDTIYTIKFHHLSSPSSVDLRSVCFINSSTGFISGAQGKIYKTTNSGGSWTDISITANETVYKVRFLSATNGFAGTENGIYRTTNGGTTWVQELTSVRVKDIYFVGSNIGYAVGADPSLPSVGYIYKTTDNGQTWNDITPPFGPKPMNGVRFLNKDTGYVAANEQNIYKTVNGGANWSFYYSPGASLNFNKLFYSTYDDGIVVGEKGFIGNFNSSGLTHELNDYDYNINGIDMLNGKGVAVGTNSVMIRYYDTDVGANLWHYYLAPDGTTIPKTYNDVAFADDASFYAVGNNGTITQFTYPQ